MSLTMNAADWLALLTHFLSLSLLAVGGAINTAPDMHRYLVTEQHWLTDTQFTSSIALAQAAPGPNVLFIALLGWNVGLNAAGGMAGVFAPWSLALLGALLAMLGILVPSTILTLMMGRWAHQNRQRRAVRAFKLGMGPIVIGLLIATGWILTANYGSSIKNWPLWLVTAISGLLVWRTRLHLLWLIGAGALLGGFGLV